ncbi:hypothetical protein DL765_002075 [Monosporascus sp. GIB2]|nr:hypothetical protein DL765_002075 [Monosporascus sp. GIB2]
MALPGNKGVRGDPIHRRSLLRSLLNTQYDAYLSLQLPSLSGLVEATGCLIGLPILNGPIPVAPQVPGLEITGSERPRSVICRGQCTNYTSFTDDARAAYQNALMWYITKNPSHWDGATSIIDAWGTNLTSIIGTDTSLLVRLEGGLLANAAEIMRWEGGWVEGGARPIGSSGFSNQSYWLFARQSIVIGQANYGMVSIKALLSFAVYLDDVTMWNYAVHAYQKDPCAGIYGSFDSRTGQGAEAGRDQGHAHGAVGWAAEAVRVVQPQGTDVYSLEDNLLLRAGEYVAKYNLGHEVPFDRKFYRCEAILVNGPWSKPSPINRGASNGTPQVHDIGDPIIPAGEIRSGHIPGEANSRTATTGQSGEVAA